MLFSQTDVSEKMLAIPTANEIAPPGLWETSMPISLLNVGNSTALIFSGANASGVVLIAK